MQFTIDGTPIFDMANRWNGAGNIVREELATGITRLGKQTEAFGKREVPVRTHTLQRSITSSNASPGRLVTEIGTQGVPYARPVHDGSRARVIVPVNKNALYWPGAKHPVKRVNHPGNRANPFMLRALMLVRPLVVPEMRAVIQRVAARLGGR